MALAIALTGIIATMPYIALQLAGMQVVFAALGLPADWNIPVLGVVHNVPLLIAFVVLAAYTYASGLRGTALIAIVKDLLIYVTVLAAIIVIPAELGGYGKVFASVDAKKLLLAHGTGGNLGGTFSYASLALGSALALFLYPHSMTGILSASSRRVVRRNAILLPAYSIALALIALLGYMAIAAGLQSMPAYADGFKTFGNNFAVPALFLRLFPAWFAGFAFAGIAVGALVPASIMAIACGNLFTRNIYKEFFAPNCTPRQESAMAKIASLLMKLGALFFVLELQTSYAIELQLLGGIWICQTLPAVLIALYTRLSASLGAVDRLGGRHDCRHRDGRGARPSKAPFIPLHIAGLVIPCYAALSALALNLAITLILSVVFNATSRAPRRGRNRGGGLHLTPRTGRQ